MLKSTKEIPMLNQYEEKETMYGFTGKILHVNLTNHTTEIEEPSEAFYREYVGGKFDGALLFVEAHPGRCRCLRPTQHTLALMTSAATGLPDQWAKPLHGRLQIPHHPRGRRQPSGWLLARRAQVCWL